MRTNLSTPGQARSPDRRGPPKIICLPGKTSPAVLSRQARRACPTGGVRVRAGGRAPPPVTARDSSCSPATQRRPGTWLASEATKTITARSRSPGGSTQLAAPHRPGRPGADPPCREPLLSAASAAPGSVPDRRSRGQTPAAPELGVMHPPCPRTDRHQARGPNRQRISVAGPLPGVDCPSQLMR